MFESKNSFIYILLSIRVPIEKKNKILFSHFILFFIYSFFGHAGLKNTPSGPSRPQWAQWGAVGRSTPPSGPQKQHRPLCPFFFITALCQNGPLPARRFGYWLLFVFWGGCVAGCLNWPVFCGCLNWACVFLGGVFFGGLFV